MITSRDAVVLKYKACVILKLALAIIAGKKLTTFVSKLFCSNHLKLIS